MPKIFISYRRTDSQYVTDSLYDHMVNHFGEDDVFLDVGSIPFGVDFRDYLRDQISEHDVILVVIGRDWAKIMQDRAGQSNDFVRIEIENALAMNKLIIPVLVKNAEMPDFSKLPASISDLQWRNSAIVRRQPDLKSDCQRLADGINQYLFQDSVETIPALPESKSPKIGKPDLRNILKLILPKPFDLIDIPAGQVILLNDWDDDPNVYLKKDQSQTFDVPEFSIGKYPVTNAQYDKFIKSKGYHNKDWWTDVGWQYKENHDWKQPRYWENSELNDYDLPVVGVTWYEALAFCNWLHDVLIQSNINNILISLPSEQQWQRAAQGDDNRIYPWGDNWDNDRCKHSVVGNDTSKTSPVMKYEDKGNSYFGVVDMSGNVWEWCLTEYYSGKQSTKDTNRRVLHGGSWIAGTTSYFKCNFRFRSDPYYHDDLRGFRIAISYT